MINEAFIAIGLVFVACLGASLLYYVFSDRKEWGRSFKFGSIIGLIVTVIFAFYFILDLDVKNSKATGEGTVIANRAAKLHEVDNKYSIASFSFNKNGNFKEGIKTPLYKNMEFYIININDYLYLSGNGDFLIQMEDKDGNYLDLGEDVAIDFSLEVVNQPSWSCSAEVYKLTDNINGVSYLFNRVDSYKDYILSDCIIMRENK